VLSLWQRKGKKEKKREEEEKRYILSHREYQVEMAFQKKGSRTSSEWKEGKREGDIHWVEPFTGSSAVKSEKGGG